MGIEEHIRSIKDFPKEGILFRDITTLIKDGDALCESIDAFSNILEKYDFDYIVSPESRGFIFGMPLAYKFKKGFIPVRKAGKLPCETYKYNYSLEYGEATIEIHKDALSKGDRVVIVDDLLATGGTSKAITELLKITGAQILAQIYLIELEDLKAREIFTKSDGEIYSIVKY